MNIIRWISLTKEHWSKIRK